MKHSPKIKHTKIIIKMDLFQTWEPCWNLLMSILVAIFLCFGVVFHSILSFFWSRLSLEPLSLPSLESLPEGTFSKHGFVDDGIGAFKDKTHADYFLTYLNSRNTDLQYTVEHPQQDGSLPFLDILIHGDRSTSVYRKPTHTNLYVKYNSTTPNSTKDSVIRSLAQRAFNLCSPQHLKTELDNVHTICLKNGFPSRRIHHIINKVGTKYHSPKPLSLKQFDRQLKLDSYPLHVLLPYHPSLSPTSQTSSTKTWNQSYLLFTNNPTKHANKN